MLSVQKKRLAVDYIADIPKSRVSEPKIAEAINRLKKCTDSYVVARIKLLFTF